jgi:hypothetical protein
VGGGGGCWALWLLSARWRGPRALLPWGGGQAAVDGEGAKRRWTEREPSAAGEVGDEHAPVRRSERNWFTDRR